MGLTVHVLTGDTRERAAALSLPNVDGNLLPEEKRQRMIEVKRAGGRPLMIGDGINDASALAAAHAGIALASGTDLANNAATATLYGGDLRVLPWAISASREAMRAIRRNLLRTAAYNVVGITLAALGILHPIAAALLMVVSSLLVVWSSVRVGSCRESCGHSEEPSADLLAKPQRPRFRAVIHALAFAVQGLILLSLIRCRRRLRRLPSM